MTRAAHVAAMTVAIFTPLLPVMAAAAPTLDGTSWVLTSLGGKPVGGGSRPTLRFGAGSVSGSDGCNRYSAPYTQDATGLRISSSMASTNMACPPEVMAQAQAFTGALGRVRSTSADATTLTLLGEGGLALATLEAIRQTLGGTTWTVVGVNNGRQAVVTLLQGTTLTMTFGPDGKVSGSAGCNRFNGPFAGDGQKVSFGNLVSTRKMCGKPEKVMEQEAAFLAALKASTVSRVEGDTLEIRDGNGALQVNAVRAATAAASPRADPSLPSRGEASLLNTYWRIVRIGDTPVTAAEGKREPHLVLQQDASGTRYRATVGCNQLIGGATVAAQALTFSAGASTLMACPPPLDQLERTLGDVLTKTRAYRLDALTLELKDAAGKPLALLEAVYL